MHAPPVILLYTLFVLLYDPAIVFIAAIIERIFIAEPRLIAIFALIIIAQQQIQFIISVIILQPLRDTGIGAFPVAQRRENRCTASSSSHSPFIYCPSSLPASLHAFCSISCFNLTYPIPLYSPAVSEDLPLPHRPETILSAALPFQ